MTLPADPLASGRTLFLPARSEIGMLVTRRGKRFHKHGRRFRGGAPAALQWCLNHKIGMVLYWPGPAETKTPVSGGVQ